MGRSSADLGVALNLNRLVTVTPAVVLFLHCHCLQQEKFAAALKSALCELRRASCREIEE
jgi:hypothetical protein